ncbi:signal peptidase I [bacterium]|nr:signal peptidase I [bacterium]
MNEKIKEKVKSEARELIETVVFVVFFVIIIRFFLIEIRWIPSGSMRPTLIEKDRIVVSHITNFFEEPKRGDVWIFYPPMTKLSNNPLAVFKRLTGFFCKDVAYIKRIIGMPGDKVEIKMKDDGKYEVLINDKPLNEPYIMDSYNYIPCSYDMYCGPFVVPEGEYFMMGDNRGNSQDSRFWGFLPKDRLIGKAVFVFWPLNRMKKI